MVKAVSVLTVQYKCCHAFATLTIKAQIYFYHLLHHCCHTIIVNMIRFVNLEKAFDRVPREVISSLYKQMSSSLCTCYPLYHYISCVPTSDN